jgi:hypothetical protein
MQKKEFRITETGQLIQIMTTESVIYNSGPLMDALQAVTKPKKEEPSAAVLANQVQSYYNLGDGVCAHQTLFGDTLKTFGGVRLNHLPFFTSWELCEDELVNDKNAFLIPALSDGLDLGAPLIMQIPSDLIIFFFIEWSHPKDINILQPTPAQLHELPKLLKTCRQNYYLTAFSKSRNTCVRLPLPNLYDDCHLCTGSAFENAKHEANLSHDGFSTSVKSSAKAWGDTVWNLDLLGGANSLRTRQYRRFIRFDAASVTSLPFSGCADWALSTSAVPLEEVYRPWQGDLRAVQPVGVVGEENLEDGPETELPPLLREDQPDMAEQPIEVQVNDNPPAMAEGRL